MKLISLAALLFGVPMISAPVLANGTIKEADYPVQYEVVNGSKSARLGVEKQCSMTLHDKAKENVDLNVARSGIGGCHLLENGKIYRGRENQKENRIEIVILVGQDKARIENWQIVGTVNNTPSPDPPSASN